MRQLKLCFIVVVIYAFAFILFSLAFSKEKNIHGKLFSSSKDAQYAATFGMETLAQISSKLFESRHAHSSLKEKIVFPFIENLPTKSEASGLEADMKCVDIFYYRALTLKSTHLQYKTSLLQAKHERHSFKDSLHRTFFQGSGIIAPLMDETEIPVEFYDAERFVRNKIKRTAEGMLGGPEFQDYGGYCILEFPDKALYLDGRRKDFQIPHASASSILHCQNGKRYRTETDNGYDPKLTFERFKQVGNALNTLYSLGISVLFQLDEFSCSFPYSEVEQMYNQLDNVTDFEYLVGYVPLVKKRSRQEKISVFQRITSYLWQRRNFDKQERQHEAKAASPDVLTFNYIVFEPLDMITGTEFVVETHFKHDFIDLFRTVMFQVLFFMENAYIHLGSHHGGLGLDSVLVPVSNSSRKTKPVMWKYTRWNGDEFYVNACQFGYKSVKIIPFSPRTHTYTNTSLLSDMFTLGYSICQQLQKLNITLNHDFKQEYQMHSFLYMLTNGGNNDKRFVLYSTQNSVVCPWLRKTNAQKAKEKFATTTMRMMPLDHLLFGPLRVKPTRHSTLLVSNAKVRV